MGPVERKRSTGPIYNYFCLYFNPRISDSFIVPVYIEKIKQSLFVIHRKKQLTPMSDGAILMSATYNKFQRKE